MKRALFILLFLAGLAACDTTKDLVSSNYSLPELDVNSPLEHKMFLIGDAGVPDTNRTDPNLLLLKQKMDEVDDALSSVVFLGDNIYPSGLHKKKHSMRAEDEAHINAQLDILEDYDGKIVFIPGNHDWKEGKGEGDKFIKRQEKYIEKYLDKGNTFLPDGGCPGPVEIRLSERLTWVIIDTQWWLHEEDKSRGDQDDCDVYDEAEFIQQVEDVLKKNRNNQVIISGHHPLYSNGNHGGYYPIDDHIFPLKKLNKNLYIPLPGVGSIYPLYRSLIGDIQDIPHYKYTGLVDELTGLFDGYDGIIYTSGHEHNLQYQQHGTAHYVISGSGSKRSYVRKNSDLIYGKGDKGFATLSYFENGEVWLEFFSPNSENPHRPTFREQLVSGHRQLEIVQAAKKTVEMKDSTAVVIPAGDYYERGKTKDLIMGELYRDVWRAPIEVPIINLAEEHGGLTPIKRGGGMQSKSLRLQAPDGKQYVLRSIQKFPETILPTELQQTFATEIIQDVISASHPYASITVAPMADAAGVLHTNPKLVYLPDDTLLGPFRNEFANLLCLYEERPDDDMSDMASFGYSKKVESSSKVIEKVREDYKNKVDAQAFLRARLFDLVIGDWDRHDDQWRWARFKEDGMNIYRPIPRDRDQVYYKVDGLVPNLIKSKFIDRRFQPFKEDIKDMPGMNFNGKYVDRAYLDELEWSDWEAMCDTLQEALTDSVFREALAQFPDTARAMHEERIFKRLQAHREKLKEFAREYYEILAKEVDIVGTYREEYFEVIRQNDDSTRVRIYPKKKHKDKKKKGDIIYERTFLTDETKEIRIYGLDNDDVYVLEGEVKKGPLIRLIGGPEEDRYINESNVKGLSKKLEVHDSREKKKKNRNKFDLGKDSRLFLTNEDDRVEYDRMAFLYDKWIPLLSVGFNPDDGVFLGGGAQFTKYGFNRSPYRYRHRLTGQYAIKTGAFNFDYRFDYRSIFHSKWDFSGQVEVKAPDYLFNFFGLGNDTEWVSDNFRDNQIRLNFIEFNPAFARSSERDVHRLEIGPTYLLANPPDEVENPTFREIGDLEENLRFENESYVGARIGYTLNNVDDRVNPHRGIRFDAQLSYTTELDDAETDFFNVKSQLTFYIPFSVLPNRATLALRTGTAANFGDYPFFLANFIDGYEQMRGYRRNRFAGDVTFYNNAELRFKLFESKNYVLPFNLGVLGFADYGRVWLEGEDSDTWHASFGGGLYFNLASFAVLTASYGVSSDDEVLLIGLGHFF
ncbi:MAG: BamA/TamA family outer membrane protein [Bacteroidota bacterium]